jgi:hypothetical protein
MIYMPLCLAHTLGERVMPNHPLSSATMEVRNGVKRFLRIRTLPRSVYTDDSSTVSTLSLDERLDDYEDFESNDVSFVKTNESSNDEYDNVSFFSCSCGSNDDWRSTVSSFSTLTTHPNCVDRKKDMQCHYPTFVDSDEISITLEVVPTFRPLQRMTHLLPTITFKLPRNMKIEPSVLEPCTDTVPVLEDSGNTCHIGFNNHDFTSLHQLYNKNGCVYQLCQLRYRLSVIINNFKKSVIESNE